MRTRLIKPNPPAVLLMTTANTYELITRAHKSQLATPYTRTASPRDLVLSENEKVCCLLIHSILGLSCLSMVAPLTN